MNDGPDICAGSTDLTVVTRHSALQKNYAGFGNRVGVRHQVSMKAAASCRNGHSMRATIQVAQVPIRNT